MEANSWPKPEPQSMDSGGVVAPGAASDWRSQLQPEARQRIINKIMETLKKHLPVNVPDGMSELNKIAVRFEDKIYTAAKDQSDYLRRISLKMLSMETKTQNSTGLNPSTSTAALVNQNAMDSASLGIQSQLGSQGQQLSIPVISQAPSMRQPVLAQNLQSNNVQPTTLQGSGGLQTSMSAISGLPQSTVTNANQASSLQNMPGISVNAIGHSSGQGAPPIMYANSQRQLQGRQQQTVVPQQHQHQSQNPMMYHPAIQQQMMKQKMQQLHPHLQQQQQAMLQSNQLQPLQQQPPMQMSSGMQSGQATLQQTQPSATAPQSALQQQSHQNSIPQSVPSPLQQHSQTALRQHQVQVTIQQSSPLQQQSAGISQTPMLASQKQQLMGQQSNMAGMQPNQLVGQQNNASDQQLQQPRLGQQNNILGLQQAQQILNQQSLSLHQQQQLGSQGNMSGLQQQQLLGTQPNLSNVQQLRSMNILQHTKTASQQQNQQQSTTMLQTQSQQIPHVQSQPTQLQQQIPMQQPANTLQREMQQRFQASGGFQSQNAIEQQKQFIPSQRALPEVSSSTSLDSTAQTGNLSAAEWQEEAYQKIKSLKEAYLPELVDFNQKISMKMQQQEALGPAVKQSEQYKRLENYKVVAGRLIQFLQMPKSSIHPGHSDKIEAYEKQILQFVNNRGRRVAQQPQLQQQFQQGAHGLPMTQQQPSQPAQVQQHDIHANQTQALNLQGSGASVQPVPTSMQHGSMPVSQLGIQASHQNMGNLRQPGATIDSTMNPLGSLQQPTINSVQHGGIGSLHNAMNTSQQNNMNSLPQSSVSMLQPNASSLQPGGNVLQQQHLKQEQQQQHQQHLVQSQQMKQQLHQRQLQQQLIQQQHKHQLLHQQPALQQQLLQQKQQQATQLTQLNQMNEVNEMKLRQGNVIKPGLYQQHYAAARHNYYNQQLKTGHPISSPQNLQVSSPQISQHSSPQIDQHGLLSSQTKAGTPMQNSNSPLVVPSPSTPVAPSPIPGDAEKQHSAVSALTNATTMGNQQSNLGPPQNQSLAVGTPGISASPLLAECTSVDGNHANISTMVTGKSTAVERPLDRLVKVVQSLSPEALNSSMRDIGSVVSMIDRIAGSAPGNGSRAGVGEDLAAMTKCRLQARNFMSQDVCVTTKKMKRHTSAMPLNTVALVCSVNDNFKQLSDSDRSDLESTASSNIERQKAKVNHTLLEEIREINQHLIETIVSVSDKDGDSAAPSAAGGGGGMVVKFSFSAVACISRLKSQFLSSHMSPIMPLRLFVPADYPKCSPVLLDKLPTDVSLEQEDLASKAKSRFSISLRGLSQPMSLGDMAKTWDVCARAVIAEYAQQMGGGSFSSRYGVWENCVNA